MESTTKEVMLESLVLIADRCYRKLRDRVRKLKIPVQLRNRKVYISEYDVEVLLDSFSNSIVIDCNEMYHENSSKGYYSRLTGWWHI